VVSKISTLRIGLSSFLHRKRTAALGRSVAAGRKPG
jgi:hypothetical protein